MKMNGCLGLAITASALAVGCGDDPAPINPADSGVAVDTGTGNPADAPAGTGAGTCDNPIDLAAAGTVMGTDLVFRGTTVGGADNLHPYEGCVMRDAEEAVLRYRVPAGVQALMVTTEGSAFDTAVYARTACSQAAGGADLACNNDSYDHAPQSTIYLTNVIEGQVLFLVVDGNAAMDTTSRGAFTLTVRQVPFGAMGTPCNRVTDPPTARCSGAMRCSEGGAADGTPICVPTAASLSACDPRQFNNLCAEGTSCITDPEPPKGMPAASVCALPGTRRNAPCRATEPRCDAPTACSTGDSPRCVPVIGTGMMCDPMGEGNRCRPGEMCSPLAAGGVPICRP